MADRKSQIEQRLRAALSPSLLEIVDESHKHIGHAGARGGGHFDVTIVSPQFAGKTLLQRHRMVYEALGEAMRDEIHALSIKALAPDETPDTRG
jgi:BolA protein